MSTKNESISHSRQKLDPARIHELLQKFRGNRFNMALFLQSDGYPDVTHEVITELIENNPVLKELWSTNPIYENIMPSPSEILAAQNNNPFSDAEVRERINLALQGQADFMMLEDMRRAGFDGEDMQKFVAMSSFAGAAFEHLVSASHGQVYKTSNLLLRRAEHIMEQVLKNEEVVERDVYLKNGSVLTRKLPRYSDNEKLEWEKMLNLVFKQIRDNAAMLTDASKTKLELEKALIEREKLKDPNRNKKQKRLSDIPRESANANKPNI